MISLVEFWPEATVLSVAMLVAGCLLRWRQMQLDELDRLQLEKRLEEMER